AMQLQLFHWFCYVIGYVFISSGIVKLLIPDFSEMFLIFGLPCPDTTLFLVAIIEIICVALLISNLYLLLSTIPLIIIMICSLYIAKFSIFLNEGFLSFVFESRLDIVMLILLIFLWRHREEFA